MLEWDEQWCILDKEGVFQLVRAKGGGGGRPVNESGIQNAMRQLRSHASPIHHLENAKTKTPNKG